jgi:nucleotide-binding universal stress UspA family protein
MYRILMAVDGSEHAGKVINEALHLAEALKAEVTVLTVVGEYVYSSRAKVHFSDDNWELINRQLEAEAEELVEKAALPFREKGLTVKKQVVIGLRSPSDVICDTAAKGDFNMVILGSRGLRGIKEAFLGSVSNKVAHSVDINVLIVK